MIFQNALPYTPQVDFVLQFVKPFILYNVANKVRKSVKLSI